MVLVGLLQKLELCYVELNLLLLLYKCIQLNLFWKHLCQRETPKEDKI